MSTLQLVQFKLNDTVQIGTAGRKGKIVDIVRPLGTYQIYKVQLFDDGSIHTAARHELVKGLPDDVMDFDLNLLFDEFDRTTSENVANLVRSSTSTSALLSNTPQSSDIFPPLNNYNPQNQTSQICEESCLDEPASNQISPNDVPLIAPFTNQPILASSSHDLPPDPFCCDLLTDVQPPKSKYSPSTFKKRFPEAKNTTTDYIKIHENQRTAQKTSSHLKILESYLAFKNESRPLYSIPPADLDKHLADFFMRVRQKDGLNYEPSTLKGIQGSIQRYLNRHKYGYSIKSDAEFAHSRECFKTKTTELKKDGKGTKPKTADEVSEEEISYLYQKGQLGGTTPESILNTLWLNNTIHFGIRGGGTEHREICWGDIQLCFDNELKKEYLIYNERQTKTRTGQDITNVRLTKPRMYATENQTRCPVELYKLYSDHRPENFSKTSDPFYLAPVTNNKNPLPTQPWFMSQAVGKNKLYNIMKNMTAKAGLETDKRLTNTSARKHLCQTLLRHDVPDAQAIQITGHKNPQSLNNYRCLTNKQQHQISTLLTDGSMPAQQSSNATPGSLQPPAQANTPANPMAMSPDMPDRPRMINTQNQNFVHNSDMSFNLNTSPSSLFRSVFHGSAIYGGTFNININMCPTTPATPQRQ